MIIKSDHQHKESLEGVRGKVFYILCDGVSRSALIGNWNEKLMCWIISVK